MLCSDLRSAPASRVYRCTVVISPPIVNCTDWVFCRTILNPKLRTAKASLSCLVLSALRPPTSSRTEELPENVYNLLLFPALLFDCLISFTIFDNITLEKSAGSKSGVYVNFYRRLPQSVLPRTRQPNISRKCSVTYVCGPSAF